MIRVVPVVIAGITVLALLAGAGVSFADPVVDTKAATNASGTTGQTSESEAMTTQATVTDTARYGRTEVNPEAGTFLAGTGGRFGALYKKHLLETKLDRASNDSRRRSELLDGAARLEGNIQDLQASHRNTYRSYKEGRISLEALVRRTVLVHMAAEGYERPVDALGDADDAVPDTSVAGEHRALTGDVLTMQGAVRNDLVDAMKSGEMTDVYAAIDRNGTVLVTLSEDRFVREAYRDDRRTRGVRPVDDISSFNSRAETRYSWLPQVEPLDTIRGGPTGDLVSVDLVANEEESISVYMNGQDKAVIREDTRLRTGNLPLKDSQTTSDGTMRLVVNRTYATGPMKVRLVDADTGEPLSGELLVDNRSVGWTGPDGTIWTVESPGETRLTVTLGTRSLTMTLDETA